METIALYFKAIKSVFEEGGLNAWLLLIFFGIIIGFIIWLLIWLLFKKD
jgi:hypothetical protein